MPVRLRIIWGIPNPLADSRLADLPDIVAAIRRGRPSSPSPCGGAPNHWRNEDRFLPAKPLGYYKEYYLAKCGPQLRLILGDGGEVYVICNDHSGGDRDDDIQQVVGMPYV